jgi:hypothetical protein
MNTCAQTVYKGKKLQYYGMRYSHANTSSPSLNFERRITETAAAKRPSVSRLPCTRGTTPSHRARVFWCRVASAV